MFRLGGIGAVRPAADGRWQSVRQTHGLKIAFWWSTPETWESNRASTSFSGAAEIARRAHPEVVFLLVGDGAMRVKLEQAARRLELDNVRFLPILPLEPFPRHARRVRRLVSSPQQKTVADIVFPSKVLTLLAAGRPVVAVADFGK